MSAKDLAVFIEAYNRLSQLKSISVRDQLMRKLQNSKQEIFEEASDRSKCHILFALAGMRSPPAELVEKLASRLLQNEKLTDEF